MSFRKTKPFSFKDITIVSNPKLVHGCGELFLLGRPTQADQLVTVTVSSREQATRNIVVLT